MVCGVWCTGKREYVVCPTLFKVSRGRCGSCANVNAALRMRRLQKATAMLRVPALAMQVSEARVWVGWTHTGGGKAPAFKPTPAEGHGHASAGHAGE